MDEIRLTEHPSPIKTVKQLIVVVVLAFVLPIALCVTLAQLVMRGSDVSKTPAMSDAAVATRMQPAGTVAIADPKAPKVERGAKEIVDKVCAACHVTGALNAPKIGDKAAWAKLIAEGLDTISADAIKGIRQMPPRGGDPSLTDAEIVRATVYMANQSGASWKEPEAKPASVAERSGEQIVQAQCSKCHQTGEGGAPKIGDRDAWIPRVKKGLEPVVRAAIGGHDNMPARGGRADLTDTEFRNAIIYMFQAGGAQPALAAPATQTAAAPAAQSKPDPAKGKAVYDASCGVCHAAGVAGAPKAGDRAGWAPRLTAGVDALYMSSLKGKNAMPPKGGNPTLADADVKAAVDYMVGLVR